MRAINCFSLLSAALLCAAPSLAGGPSTVVTTGQILEVNDPSGADIGSTVDYWEFTVHSAGPVTIDTLSWEVDYEDLFDGDGDFTETVDVNNDGEIAFIDVYVYLFNDDGSLDLADLITSNDDDFTNTYTDGSIYGYDSYLGLNLAPGDYVLALGAYFLDDTEAVSGFNDETFYPTTADGLDNFFNIGHGDYQITWTGDLTVHGVIPEPATALLLLALAPVGLMRR